MKPPTLSMLYSTTANEKDKDILGNTTLVKKVKDEFKGRFGLSKQNQATKGLLKICYIRQGYSL